MMKRCLLLCSLLLTLMLPASLAEEPYIPGNVTTDLFAQAFARGDMIMADMQLGLSIDPELLGLPEDEAAVMEPLLKALENATLRFGAGKAENGLRIVLGGEYAQDGQKAALDAAATISKDGLSVESSLIPGERVSARWETLLALCGASESDIATIMALKDADIEALLAELIAQIGPVLDTAGQILAPYGQTILTHLAMLPMDIRQDVPAENGYPAAAMETYVQVTAKALGGLIIALSEQLEQDATLCAILDALLAEMSETEGVTTVEFCQILRQAAQNLTDEAHPLHIYLGFDASGTLIYLNLIAENEDGTLATLNYIAGTLEESGAALVNLDVLMLTAEQEILHGFSFVSVFVRDAANAQIYDLNAYFSAYADGIPFVTLECLLGSAALSDQEGYSGTYAMAFSAGDGETVVDMTLDAGSTAIKAADGGESFTVAASIDMNADDMQIPMTIDASLLTTPGADSPVASIAESVKLPSLGINEYHERYSLYIQPQTASAPLSETALETAGEEDINALAGRAAASLEALAAQLETLLPPELIAALSE